RAKRNIRGDWRQEDNTLPSRVLTEALPTDVAQGVGLTKADLDMMLQGYYRSQGIIVAVDRSSVCSAQQSRPRMLWTLPTAVEGLCTNCFCRPESFAGLQRLSKVES